MQPLINEEKKIFLTPRRIQRSSNISSSNNLAMKHRIFIISSLFAFLLFIQIIISSNFKIYSHNAQVEGWAKNTSRDTTEYILPNENTTLIEPPSLCAVTNTDPIFLLIVVCSSASNFEARQTIRETWANTSQFNYPLFEKFHGAYNNNNASYLNINYKQLKKYAEVCVTKRRRSYSIVCTKTFVVLKYIISLSIFRVFSSVETLLLVKSLT